MKSMSFSGLFKLVCLLCVFAVAGRASAENKLYVEDFTISNYDVNKVAVMLDNTDEIAALDFTLVLPDGINLVGVPEKTERFAPSQTVQHQYFSYKEDDKYRTAYKVVVVSFQPNRNFSGNEGPVLYLNLQANPGELIRNSESTLELKDITLSDGTGSQAWTPADVKAKVTKLSGEFEITAPEAAYVVKPEVPLTVSVGIDNSAEITGLQADIVVPEGFTVDENSFALTNRCVAGLVPTVNPQADGVTTRVLLYNMAGGNVVNLPVPGAENNYIFTFNVTAPATFADAHADIIVKNVTVTALGNQTFDAGTAKIGLENGKVPYDAAVAEVARLRAALAKALETIATDAPDVASKFPGEAITAQIDALEAAVNKAYESATPAAGYEAVLAPVPTIDEAIAKLVADAKAAQEAEVARQKANTDAYSADLAAIEALQGKLDAAAAEVAEKYPVFDASEATEAAQAAIDAAKAAALAAFEKVAEEGNYENTLDTAKIEELIAKLVADAKAAQEAEDARVKANTDAYNADLAAIEALQGKLDAAAAEVAEKYPDFDASEAAEAAQAAIDAAKADALAAFEKVAEEGNYENTVDVAKIEELIKALTDAAAMSGIDSIIIDAEAGNAAIYNLQGVKLAHPVQGQMHIVVDKAGKAYKVFIR